MVTSFFIILAVPARFVGELLPKDRPDFMRHRNIFAFIQEQVLNAAQQVLGDVSLNTDKVTVEWPREEGHGELATNAAMVLAGQAKTNPRALAGHIADRLRQHSLLTAVDVAGPGFINLTLAPSVWQDTLKVIHTAAPYGIIAVPHPPVNLEFVSANPTGPLHIGHTRGAVFGDALARLLETASIAVTREYYVNDAGGQIDILAQSLYHRYRQALGLTTQEVPTGLYPGDYLREAAAQVVESIGTRYGASNTIEWLPVFRRLGIDAMMALIKEDLQALGIAHDVFVSEATLETARHEALTRLKEQGLASEGTLPPPKGKEAVDWEPTTQLLFHATRFGDDVDRALLKADGTPTYFAGDVAYHYDKIHNRGFTALITVLGADHAGYVKRLQAMVGALSDGAARVDVKICQLVSLLQNGQPYKMSKRAGTFITAREVVDDIGKDALRFMMLARRNDVPFEFDVARVKEQSRDNPVFYVQYAHARCHSVFRHAEEGHGIQRSAVDWQAVDVSFLTHPAEIALLRRLAFWPQTFLSAVEAQEPHRLCAYVQDLAHAFHHLWNQGRDNMELRFIDGDDKTATMARLALVFATQRVLSLVLGIMGVSAPEEM
jgi:arginyl-tRNA synthetase